MYRLAPGGTAQATSTRDYSLGKEPLRKSRLRADAMTPPRGVAGPPSVWNQTLLLSLAVARDYDHHELYRTTNCHRQHLLAPAIAASAEADTAQYDATKFLYMAATPIFFRPALTPPRGRSEMKTPRTLVARHPRLALHTELHPSCVVLPH